MSIKEMLTIITMLPELLDLLKQVLEYLVAFKKALDENEAADQELIALIKEKSLKDKIETEESEENYVA